MILLDYEYILLFFSVNKDFRNYIISVEFSSLCIKDI